jgi:hypothetical protein
MGQDNKLSKMFDNYKSTYVATFALGLRPRLGLAKVWVESEAWESHFMLLGV